jgi:neutrophil factor 2
VTDQPFVHASSILTLPHSYFQCGVSNFLLGRYELAFSNFEAALLYLRGNQAINYEQLGLKFRLYSAEVLFNKGLCLVYLGSQDDGLQDMREAQKEKATEEHNVIDEAIADGGEGYTVFSIVRSSLCLPFLRTLLTSLALI